MIQPSATPTDHLSAMYDAWCNGMPQHNLYGCMYHMATSRGMQPYCHEDINELNYYVECFEYGLEPSDPAFCHECRIVLGWMMKASTSV